IVIILRFFLNGIRIFIQNMRQTILVLLLLLFDKMNIFLENINLVLKVLDSN
ncbi:hypothetical protein S83_043253, partial [Arachis hypogaea]